jgi:hypothetical protein
MHSVVFRRERKVEHCGRALGLLRVEARDEPIRPMALGNMRQNGVRGLFVTCQHCGYSPDAGSRSLPSSRLGSGRLPSMRNHTTWVPVVLCTHPVQCCI